LIIGHFLNKYYQ